MYAEPSQSPSESSQPVWLQQTDAVVSALLQTASAGLNANFPEGVAETLDVELVLDALRVLRPEVPEIELLQGILHMVKGRWDAALMVLQDVMEASPSFSYAKAMYAFCLASKGDPDWRRWADEELADDAIPETRTLIRTLRIRADLIEARRNHKGGTFVVPESYREFEQEKETLAAATASTGAADGATSESREGGLPCEAAADDGRFAPPNFLRV